MVLDFLEMLLFAKNVFNAAKFGARICQPAAVAQLLSRYSSLADLKPRSFFLVCVVCGKHEALCSPGIVAGALSLILTTASSHVNYHLSRGVETTYY
jgi:hypothetical protein